MAPQYLTTKTAFSYIIHQNFFTYFILPHLSLWSESIAHWL
jgi:hypothetical protein